MQSLMAIMAAFNMAMIAGVKQLSWPKMYNILFPVKVLSQTKGEGEK